MTEEADAGLWFVMAGATLLLVTLPWMPRAKPQPVAQVDPANCNGCGRCYVDCPYAAVTMRERSLVLPRDQIGGREYARIAVVDGDLCASCGICGGFDTVPMLDFLDFVGIKFNSGPFGQCLGGRNQELVPVPGCEGFLQLAQGRGIPQAEAA